MKRFKYIASRVIIWITLLITWALGLIVIAAITASIEGIAGKAMWLGAIGFAALAIWAFDYKKDDQ